MVQKVDTCNCPSPNATSRVYSLISRYYPNIPGVLGLVKHGFANSSQFSSILALKPKGNVKSTGFTKLATKTIWAVKVKNTWSLQLAHKLHVL